MAVSWRFDGDSRLSGVGAEWDEFALANDGGSCVPPPLGRSLTDLVSSTEVCVLWEAIFGLTRREHGRTVKLTYRCDAPGERRVAAATVTGVPGGEVEIVSSVERRESRPVVRLLDPADGDRRGEMIRMCSWCARVQVDGWVDVEEGCRRLGLLELGSAPLPGITHGICTDCMAAVARGLNLPAHH